LGRTLIACEIAGLGLQEGLQHLGQEVSEAELASTIEGAIGTVGVGHRGARLARGLTYVMSGENGSRASLPFNVSSERKMRAGDSVLVELNVQADGFWVDMAKTWFVGKSSLEHQRYYEVVREANEKAIEYAKEGAPVKEVDAVARGVVSASGIGHMFNHRLGHGIGFRLHEPPSVHPASN
jgi:Xaa-Pro aminopeptidase